jgi:hypothetical protein
MSDSGQRDIPPYVQENVWRALMDQYPEGAIEELLLHFKEMTRDEAVDIVERLERAMKGGRPFPESLDKLG